MVVICCDRNLKTEFGNTMRAKTTYCIYSKNGESELYNHAIVLIILLTETYETYIYSKTAMHAILLSKTIENCEPTFN